MTDRTETLARHRLPLSRDQISRAKTYLGPAMRFAPRHPLMLIGALLVSVGGILAWRNREAIARTASPIIEDARMKGHALIEEALSKGHDLMEEAKAAGVAITSKANGLRHSDKKQDSLSDVY